jgi:hypothetical protein
MIAFLNLDKALLDHLAPRDLLAHQDLKAIRGLLDLLAQQVQELELSDPRVSLAQQV